MERYFNQMLNEYCNRDLVAMHMPGHKRTASSTLFPMGLQEVLEACKAYDVTELPGLDDLHHPSGALMRSQQQAAEIYESYRSIYLINGTTVGILAAISAACTPGGTVLMARNCHISVYHAVELNQLTPIYLSPKILEPYHMFGSISPSDVKEALDAHPEIQAVILPSPTYEGIASDISSIAEAVHNAGATFLVDAAHGAHLPFLQEGLNDPQLAPALSLGADLVIESLHKSLPCLTQCAILHINRHTTPHDPEFYYRRVMRYLSFYETSSPSFLLLASIENAIIDTLAMKDTRIPDYLDQLKAVIHTLEAQPHIKVLTADALKTAGAFAYDPTKLELYSEDSIDYAKLAALLEQQYGIVVEMSTLYGCTLISSVSDSFEAFARLQEAICDINRNYHKLQPMLAWKYGCKPKLHAFLSSPELSADSDKVSQSDVEYRPYETCQSQICADFVVPYPPGIPLTVPGVRITNAHIEYLKACQLANIEIHGMINDALPIASV